MTRYHLTVAPTADDLARQAAEQVASGIDLALAERDRAQIALAGGSTPMATYRRLGAEHLPWERVDVLLGDERWVPADDPASNARMIAATLLDQPPARRARFHPVPTDREDPEAGAAAYAELIAQLCPGDPPRFDVVLLGLGEDGHTASLFPHSPALGVSDRSVTVGEGKGLARLTLTAPVLSAARRVIFLVSGEGKREALRRLMDPQEPAERTPARLVRPVGEVVILADADAAGTTVGA
ncbi:MAG: 6-phosphogluconolactonase [Synechococcaceae cyanobacterium]|nr:6-phosphogluconolactonase [Synechococcaceae cyanobacterium]